MRKFIGLMILVVCLPGLGIAGQIYGNLKQDNRSVSNVQVIINCGSEQRQARTDDYGAYSIFMPQSGRCSMTVQSGEQWSVAHPIYSSGEPTRYDFDLIWNGGTLSLRRR